MEFLSSRMTRLSNPSSSVCSSCSNVVSGVKSAWRKSRLPSRLSQFDAPLDATIRGCKSLLSCLYFWRVEGAGPLRVMNQGVILHLVVHCVLFCQQSGRNSERTAIRLAECIVLWRQPTADEQVSEKLTIQPCANFRIPTLQKRTTRCTFLVSNLNRSIACRDGAVAESRQRLVFVGCNFDEISPSRLVASNLVPVRHQCNRSYASCGSLSLR
jgi:hypothetical protein